MNFRNVQVYSIYLYVISDILLLFRKQVHFPENILETGDPLLALLLI